MLEGFVITEHAVERYLARTFKDTKNYDIAEVKKQIRKDLSYKKIKRIITRGNIKYVFTYHSKEFVFIKRNNKWILKTVIKRNREDNLLAINKRLAAC